MMAKSMKLNTKLLLAFLAVGVIPLAVIGFVSLSQSAKALSRQATAQLQSIREIKKTQIENFYAERQQDMESLISTVSALRQEAYRKIKAVQDIKTAQLEEYFTRAATDISVLSRKPQVLETFDKMGIYMQTENIAPDDALKTDNEMFIYMCNDLGPYFASYFQDYGYGDVYVIKGDSGQVLISGKLGPDLGTNLKTGPYKNDALASIWKRVMADGKTCIEDFSIYAPIKNKPAAFIGAPVSQDGKVIGVVALQILPPPIDAIVNRNTGMGTNAGSYVLGKDAKGRIAFRCTAENLGGSGITYEVGQEYSTPYMEKALAGESGEALFKEGSGTLVTVAYNPLKLAGLNWALASKVNLEDVIAPKLVGSNEDFFARFVKENGYSDVLLVNAEGYCFYSVTHQSDYRSNVVLGDLAESNVGTLVKKVLSDKKFGLSDFAPYAPGNNIPAAFLAAPLLNAKGGVDIVVALQLPVDANNRIMQQRAGMGKTGETYLVGSDKLMRSDSLEDAIHHSVATSFADPKKGSMDTLAVREALAGKTGESIFATYDGHKVISAYTPIRLGDFTWVLVADLEAEEAFGVVNRIEVLMGIIAAIGLLAILLTAWLVTRSISKPIQHTIKGLTEASEQVSSASAQLSAASQSLAEGTSEQAASLEETTSSLEEMASMIKNNADNAGEASSLSAQTKATAEDCSVTMQEMETAIGQVNDASTQTKKIVKTIDEIAFQTNLLALNAAVEAARAGQAGAGFAVVADEVRNLAMRSAQAAKNTTEQIEDIGRKISEAIRKVTRSVEQFADVSTNTGKVNELVNEIASASREQAQGIEQLNGAVHELDKVIQQNSANAEESASSSMEMQSQASAMKGIVVQLTAMVRGGRLADVRKNAGKSEGEKRRKGKGRTGGGLLFWRRKASKAAVESAESPAERPVARITGKGNGSYPSPTPGRKGVAGELKPEQVIPFEEEEFTDF